MNRFLTLASTGLFATGLAILPVSAFAQSTPPAGVDAKSTTTTGVVGSTAMPHKADAGKVVAAPASSHATDAKGDKSGAKAAVTTAPATGSMTTGTTATGGAKVTTAPAPSATPVAPMPKSGG